MSKERTRILIVDDEEIVRESLSAWLEKDGYTLATAPDGETALERVKGERWSILLVDLKMPGHRRPAGARGGAHAAARGGRRHHDRLRHGRHRGRGDEARRLRLPGQAVRPRGAEPDDPEDRHAAGPRARERAAAQGAQARVPVPRLDQQEPRDAGGVRPGAHRRAQRVHDPDPRRERHRQGTARPRHPRREPPQPGAVRRGLVRRAHRDAARVRAVRPREGRLHRGRRPPQGQVRDGAGRHAVPRRDRRHQPEAAARPAARARGPAVLPRRRHRVGRGRRPHHRRHQPRPAEGRRRRRHSARISSTA